MHCNILGRRLDEDSIRKASAVLCINLFAVILAVLVIVTVQPAAMTDVAFEVVSAIGTVGMSTGITRDMETVSKLVLIFLMYCGRIGSMTFALLPEGNRGAREGAGRKDNDRIGRGEYYEISIDYWTGQAGSSFVR